MLIKDAVRVERDDVRSPRQSRSINARRLHVEIALASFESEKRRRAAAGVAQRNLYVDAQEIERQETAQVATRCCNACIVKGLWWMPEILHGPDAGVARYIPDGS